MILVTGSTGHIGNVLVRQLVEAGEKVRAMILPGESTQALHGLPIETVTADVLDPASLRPALKGVERVFHLAGIITIMPGENPLVRRVNVEGTRNMLRAAYEAGVKRFVYTSSIHALQRARTGIVDERLPYDPENPYGAYDRSKAEATLEVQQAAQAGQDIVIVCPTGVIGPYDYRLSELGKVIFDAAIRKPSLYVDGAYDFVDVRDVARGLILSAEKGQAGASYILSGARMSVRYLLETIREITGHGFFQLKIPLRLAQLGANFAPAYYRLANEKPRFTPYALEVLQSNSNISHAKATRELGYQPRALHETLRDTIHWFIENRKLLNS